MKTYLLIPHLHIFDANASACVYVAGFPAMTSWLGAVHALQRKIQQTEGLSGVSLPRMTVSSHSFQLLTKTSAAEKKATRLIAKKFPVKKKKNSNEFVSASLQVAARCELCVSLLIEVEGLREEDIGIFEDAVRKKGPGLRFAGGCAFVQASELPRWKVFVVGENDGCIPWKALRNKLLPGFVPIARSDLMEKNETTNKGDALDRLILALRGGVDTKGWLVPLVIGFKDLSGKTRVLNQRSYQKEHHFVEPIVTAGEFRSPFRFDSIDDMMWEYKYNTEDRTYLCENKRGI